MRSSERYHDQLKTPLETAKHWIVHVAKNKGAQYLKSVSVDLPLYKLYNLDVWTFVGGVLILIGFALKLLIQRAASAVLWRSKKKEKTD